MIRSKRVDLICILAIVLASIMGAGLFLFAIKNNKIKEQVDKSQFISTDYVDGLFDDSYVHSINIIVSDLNWNYMIENAHDEQYVLCDATIDGNLIKNIAIRPKGNSSLTSIEKQNSQKFSFKIEFDHYKAANTYMGLDKMALNNLGSDPTCMKDYFAYHMMNEMGVAAPLSAYTLVMVNGEEFGLYLMTEAIEDSFCYRNYGDEYGKLYRPDVYDIDSITPASFQGIENNDVFQRALVAGEGERIDILGNVINTAFSGVKDKVDISAMKYAGDNVGDYDVIFDTASYKIKREDKLRLIEAMKQLDEGNVDEALELDSVMKYFVVHGFVNNYDSYNSVFVHNFYLHEKDGKLSLIPWDYNLAFGAFSLESAVYSFFNDSKYQIDMSDMKGLPADKSFINYPIDEPVIQSKLEDRPMIFKWLEQEEYRQQYHKLYQSFLDEYFYSGRFASEYERLYSQLRPYVQKNLTFITVEKYDEATKEFEKYNLLRAESVQQQLDGQIPATISGQEASPESLLSCDDVNLGKTIDFGGLAWGITGKDIEAVLDAIAPEDNQTSEGVQKGVEKLMEDPEGIADVVSNAISGSDLLRELVAETIRPAISFLFAVLAIIIGLRLIKGYRRR